MSIKTTHIESFVLGMALYGLETWAILNAESRPGLTLS